MKKYILLLLTTIAFGQTYQNPTYGTVTTKTNVEDNSATKVNVQNSNGTINWINKTAIDGSNKAQADTGVFTFGGLVTNSATTINIGAANGQIMDNETNPLVPVRTVVTYAGATGVTVTTVGSGNASYVMLGVGGVISFQNTFPTSAERKTKILLGKVSHPAGSVTLVINEPDYVLSPQALVKDWIQDSGPYINNGVFPYANGANLNINVTGGTITGNGINFVTSNTNPNHIEALPASVANFAIRTQTGGATATTNLITPAVYDNAGTITAIGGGAGASTIQHVEYIPGQGYIIQLGQQVYSTFNDAVAAVGRENPSFIRWSNLVNNAIPIGVIVVNKSATALNNPAQALFFKANKTGDFFGAQAGVSTGTLQTAYVNSVVPQITTTAGLGALTIQRGSAADTDNIFAGRNGAGTTTASITGAGIASALSHNSTGSISASGAIARGNYFNNTLVATANNDVLVGLDINPTFTNGAFTGVQNVGLLINGAIKSRNTDIILQKSDGQAIFRGLRANSWVDNVSSTFFQVGSSSDNSVFSAQSATPFNRLLFSSNNTHITNSFYNFAKIPTGILEVGSQTESMFNVFASGRSAFGNNIDNGVDRLQVAGSILSTGYKVTGTTGYLKSDGTVDTDITSTEVSNASTVTGSNVTVALNNLKSSIPAVYSTVVYVNTTDPNSATIFDDVNPPVVNDNSLKANVNNLYVATNSSGWVYNSTTLLYQTKTELDIYVNNLTLSPNPVGSTPNKLKQAMADTDYWSIYGEASVADIGKMVFELGDNATPVGTDGESFEFRYVDDATPANNKTTLSIDYDEITANAHITAKGINIDAASGVNYGSRILGVAGGARNILLAGHSGFSNGFTVQYTGTEMLYKFLNGTINVGNLAGTGTRQVVADASGNLSATTPQPLKYVALLTQSGTSAPVATVLENTLGVTITFSYLAVGKYAINAPINTFANNKTAIFITNNSVTNTNFGISRTSDSQINLSTQIANTATFTDSLIFPQTTVEIRVYP